MLIGPFWPVIGIQPITMSSDLFWDANTKSPLLLWESSPCDSLTSKMLNEVMQGKYRLYRKLQEQFGIFTQIVAVLTVFTFSLSHLL